MTKHLTHWSDPEVEERLLSGVSLAEPWALVERFSTLVRESGTPDEWAAAQYVADRLRTLGIPHVVHEPLLFISLPREADLRVGGKHGRPVRAKTPSMSVSTGDEWVEGDLLYVPTGYAKSTYALFDASGVSLGQDVSGKIILTEGFPMPGKVAEFSALGVAAMIFISPGEAIHEGICTPIWGAPDLDNVDRQPAIPVIAISRSDGARLKEEAQVGPVRVALRTRLEQGWVRCPLVEATIPGAQEPDKFVLLHGHIDSWHVGIGDNATGNAALLEVARLLWENRAELKRTVRIAWWPGHSTGRYAGSTWYADTFAIDIAENCIAHINCDSPGCRWATSYHDVATMTEAVAMLGKVIEDVTGQQFQPERPLRAGDISFNNLGVTTFLMLSSTMPEELRQEKGYYSVGGCGGNIEWHTEDDRLHVADQEILLTDIKIYALATFRAANAPVAPFDYAATAHEIRQRLVEYQEAAGDAVDLSPAIQEAERLANALEAVYQRLDLTAPVTAEATRRANEMQRRIGRLLVNIHYARQDRFRQDPALNIPPLPDLAPASMLAALDPESHMARVVATHLVRGRNRITWALREAVRLAEAL